MNEQWKKTLENIKVVAEAFNAVWPILKMILIAAGTALVTVMIVNTGKQDEIDVFVAQYESAKTQADSASAYADKLKKEIETQRASALAAETRAAEYSSRIASLNARTEQLTQRRLALAVQLDSVKTIADSVETYSETVSVQDSIIAKKDTIITNQQSQINQLDIALAHKDTTIILLTVSRDSLQTAINKLPPVPTNPNRTIFGIKLPSRKTSFIIGALAGAATATVILR